MHCAAGLACNHQLSIAVINFHRYSANLSAASFTYTQLMVDYTDYTCTVILDIGQTPCVTLQQRIIYRLHDIQSSSAGRRVCPAVHIVIKILKTFQKIIKLCMSENYTTEIRRSQRPGAASISVLQRTRSCSI